VKARYFVPSAVVAMATLSVLVASASAGKPASHAAATFKVGLVADVAGVKDNGFNQLASAGLQQAVTKLGIQGDVAETRTADEYIPKLTAFAQQGYNLVIGVRMVGELAQVAVQYPNVTFAGVDITVEELLESPANFIGIKFKEQEAGYLAGYLAGLVIDNSNLKKVASAIGGFETPEIEPYIAGYIAGLHRADRKIKVLHEYADTVTERAVCNKAGASQIKKGASVLFAVAGRCGDAALDAAKLKRIWGIGVDVDQSSLGKQMLTSAVKKIDAGVFATISAVHAGTLKGGADVRYGSAQGAVGLGKIHASVPKAIVKKVLALEAQIRSGKVTNIPTVVK
jgi:basic membrane protein A